MKKPQSKKSSQNKSVSKPEDTQKPELAPLDEIRDDIEQVLEGVISRSKKGEVVEAIVQVVSQEIYSGPLPHPKHLLAYENACPGAADRILTMAEKSQSEQLKIPAAMIKAESGYRNLGLLFGFLTLTILVSGAIYSANIGNNILAGLLLSIGALGTIGRFIDGSRRQKRAREEND
jgi:uncharacterized membrane protein